MHSYLSCGTISDRSNQICSLPSCDRPETANRHLGDNLEDAGTYSEFAQKNFGRGLFTTNPGKIWTQQVATYYGDTFRPAFLGGFVSH